MILTTTASYHPLVLPHELTPIALYHPVALPNSVPRVSHAYAEAGLLYQLVVTQNEITVSDNLISRRIHDPNYSLAGFNPIRSGLFQTVNDPGGGGGGL